MEQHLAFAVKEEILRNVIRTHNKIIVSGWAGAGKTATALRAGRGLFDIYYYNESDTAAASFVTDHNDAATVLKDASELGSLKSERVLLIIDDVDKAGSGTLEAVRDFISDKSKKMKILLITRVLMDVRDLLPEMDVVVRFKQETAEMLLTNLCDPGKY